MSGKLPSVPRWVRVSYGYQTFKLLMLFKSILALFFLFKWVLYSWRYASHLINYEEPSFENILRFYPLRNNLWSRKSAKEWCLTKRYCTWPQGNFPKITSLSKYLRVIFTPTKNLLNCSSQALLNAGIEKLVTRRGQSLEIFFL